MNISPIYIFVGPSIALEEARAILEANYLPPVSQGDVYRLKPLHPKLIGIIDGYFEGQPAVWHKEILWAMSEGIHVVGASSMGALRAAELSAFGMQGVGRIFKDFLNGVLTDDDEVAIIHGDKSTRYRVLSDAMVNIRYTLRAAEESGKLSSHVSAELCRIAKERFYPERLLPSIVESARLLGLPEMELQSFLQWLPANYVNQKHLDSVAMITDIRERVALSLRPEPVSFSFENTVFWHDLTQSAGALGHSEASGGPITAPVTTDQILDELRLLDHPYRKLLSDASLRHLLLEEANRRGGAPIQTDVDKSLATFRTRFNLETDEVFQVWLTSNDLDAASLRRLFQEECLLVAAHSAMQRFIPIRIVEELQLRDEYSHYKARAQMKRHVLQFTGLDLTSLEDAHLDEPALVAWHFRRLGMPLPVDITEYRRQFDFETHTSFLRALLHEYLFMTAAEQAGLVPDDQLESSFPPPGSSRPKLAGKAEMGGLESEALASHGAAE